MDDARDDLRAGIQTNPGAIAQGPGGTARAAWSELHGSTWTLVTADRAPDGSWSPPADLVPIGSHANVQLRTDTAGNSVMTVIAVTDSGSDVSASTRGATTAWSALTSLSPQGIDAASADLAINRDGDALVTMVLDGAVHDATTWVRSKPLAHTWSPLVQLAPGTNYTFGSSAALGDDGTAVVTWSKGGTVLPTVQAVTSPAPAPIAPPPPVVLVPRFTG